MDGAYLNSLEPEIGVRSRTLIPMSMSEPMEQQTFLPSTPTSTAVFETEPLLKQELLTSESKLNIKAEPFDFGPGGNPLPPSNALVHTADAYVSDSKQNTGQYSTTLQTTSKCKDAKFPRAYPNHLVGMPYTFTGEQRPYRKHIVSRLITKCGGSVHKIEKLKRPAKRFSITIIKGDGAELGPIPDLGGRDARIISQRTIFHEKETVADGRNRKRNAKIAEEMSKSKSMEKEKEEKRREKMMKRAKKQIKDGKKKSKKMTKLRKEEQKYREAENKARAEAGGESWNHQDERQELNSSCYENIAFKDGIVVLEAANVCMHFEMKTHVTSRQASLDDFNNSALIISIGPDMVQNGKYFRGCVESCRDA